MAEYNFVSMDMKPRLEAAALSPGFWPQSDTRTCEPMRSASA